MGNVFFFDWEVPFMVLLQSCSSPFLSAAATFFTMFGDEYLTIVILGLLYWCIDKDLGRRTSLALSGTMVCSTMVKGLALRRRPYMDNSEVKCIRAAHPRENIMSPTEQGFSMPSLHSSMSVSVYGTLAYKTKKPLMIALGFLLPLIIGLSRIYLGVHYPTDVISGWFLGTVLMFALNALYNRYGYKIGFAVVLVIGAAGFFFCRDNEFSSGWGITLGLLLGFAYEEKYVHFEAATKWWSYILRPAMGVVIFAVVSAVLKLPAKAIHGEGMLFLYRVIRYTISTFIIIGPYPHLFRKNNTE